MKYVNTTIKRKWVILGKMIIIELVADYFKLLVLNRLHLLLQKIKGFNFD